MNNRTMGSILFAVGVGILIYAMVFMEVSLSGQVVNLNLLSMRQNLVTIGIVAAVGGLILRYAPTASRTSSRSEEKATSSTIAQQLERLQLDPIRTIRLASLLLMPIGALLTYKWLYGPIEESSAALLIFGLLLYFGPIFADVPPFSVAI